jgi:hypothetical protein
LIAALTRLAHRVYGDGSQFPEYIEMALAKAKGAQELG